MERRSENRKDIFEENAWFGKIGCLCYHLSKNIGLLVSLFTEGVYLITGELGGYDKSEPYMVNKFENFKCGLRVVVAWDFDREEEPWLIGSVTTVDLLMMRENDRKQRVQVVRQNKYVSKSRDLTVKVSIGVDESVKRGQRHAMLLQATRWIIMDLVGLSCCH